MQNQSLTSRERLLLTITPRLFRSPTHSVGLKLELIINSDAQNSRKVLFGRADGAQSEFVDDHVQHIL